MSKELNEDITNRLSKIEGQIRGIKNMLLENRDCEDIIMQLSAVNSAITSTAKKILNNHIEHCVADGIKSGDEEQTLNNLKKVIEQFAKLK